MMTFAKICWVVLYFHDKEAEMWQKINVEETVINFFYTCEGAKQKMNGTEAR
jgi:hypothetical protein